jgi:hypothetical protein|nr:MAG TPA: hypothetical protein [Caudoviricetes sp.]
MAVSITAIKEAIQTAFNNEKDKADDQAGSIERIAQAIADVVAEQIVQGINTAAVVPTLTSPTGAVTGKITITAKAE